MSEDFVPEQKRWLEGFLSGAAAIQAARKVATPVAAASTGVPTGPDAPALLAQDRTVEKGGKLVDQEKWKRGENPLDAYARLKADAKAGLAPKPDDNFRWRYHGLFYVAPTQASYMCRLRIPNGILNHWQMQAAAEIAETKAGGYSHVTTRANLQMRGIKPENGPDVLESLLRVGLVTKGSGADNIRNVTGSSTAGIDPQELLDTREAALDWHNHILNTRAMYGLPRKFNVAFDGGGRVATLEDTNDIGFQAVEVAQGAGVDAGVWWRLALGGVSGHLDLARDTGVVVALNDSTAVADAIVRVFIDHGDRANRNKARLKYVLDAMGFEKFLELVEEKLGRALARVAASFVKPRPIVDRLAHIGVHAQKQDGLNWIGVWTPLGRMTPDQMRALARASRECGDGDIRLTVWQNLLISGVPAEKIEAARKIILDSGLKIEVSNVRAGLVACTGNTGCKFAAADTKGAALKIAEHLDARLDLDQPVNIHLTGCHHSCAQHYIGDIGLIAAKVNVPGNEDQVEGYHIHAGGGYAERGSIARLVISDVTAEHAPARVESLLRAYINHRAAPTETFHAFAARHDVEALKKLAEEVYA